MDEHSTVVASRETLALVNGPVARLALYGQAVYAALVCVLFCFLAVGTADDIRTQGYSSLEGATVHGLVAWAVFFGVAAACFGYVGWHVGHGRRGWDRAALGLQLPASLFVWVVARRLSLTDAGDLFLWAIICTLTAVALATLTADQRRNLLAGRQPSARLPTSAETE